MVSNRLSLAMSLVILLEVWGCTGARSSSTNPFFMPTLEDAPRLAKLTHELNTKALRCVEAANCEQVSFGRAMVSLFENREAARASFRHVIEHNHASPLAHSSQLWLRLIETYENSAPLIEITAQFVREWMERELNERSHEKPVTFDTVHEGSAEQPRVLQALQRQVRERDRQLAALRAQLEALRAIDEEHAAKQRKVKPPASLTIAEPYTP